MLKLKGCAVKRVVLGVIGLVVVALIFYLALRTWPMVIIWAASVANAAAKTH